MSSVPCPEIREVDGQNRTWSLGSQLLGHYDAGHLAHQDHALPTGQHAPYSPSSTVFESHDGTTQLGQTQELQGQSGIPSTLPPSTIHSEDDTNQDRRPLLRASTTFYDRVLTDWWWWELFSWLVSFSCVTTIVGVLAFYNGKRQPEYVIPYITLNAFVAIFAAIAKSALILPVSEAIGQLKWLWYKKESSLWDFFTFDSASRGPWGSLMLFGTTKGRHLVSLGAAITILSLAFEPFFQQIVSFPARDISTGFGSIAVAHTYRQSDGDISYQSASLSQPNRAPKSMLVAIEDATISRDNSTRQAPARCPTGRCDWTAYNSLGVCHMCEDVSHLLQYICEDHSQLSGFGKENLCGYRLNTTLVTGARGPRLKYTLQMSVFGVGKQTDSVGRPRWNSTLYNSVPGRIHDFYIAYTPGGEEGIRQNNTPVLQECLFHWCIKSYSASHREGLLRERLLSTFAELPAVPDERNAMTGVFGIDEQMSPAFNMSFGGENYTIPENMTLQVGRAINGILPFSKLPLDETGQFPGKWNFVQVAPYDSNYLFGSITDAITNSIRAHTKDTEWVNGTAWSTENFVEIRWPWVSLPAILLLSTLIFVGATASKSHKHQFSSWKSSSLSTLLHGLTEDARDRFDFKASPSEIEAMSRNVRVRLSTVQDGSTRLVLA